jgi:ABC-type transport system involved in cytochrome bd biosynthesis fused ATPase/permease subunit
MRPRNGAPTLVAFRGGLRSAVLRERNLLAWFTGSAVLQAAGHGALAVTAGLLAKTLAAPGSGSGKPDLPFVLAVIGLAATVVKGLGATLGATAQSRLAQKVANAIRKDLVARLLAAGASRSAPDVAARLAVQTREVESGIEDGLLGGLRSVAQLVPLAVALVMLSPSLAIGAVTVLGPFAVLTALARRAWKRSHVRALGVAEDLHKAVDDLAQNIDLWRTYDAGEPVERALVRLGGELEAAASRTESVRAALSSANETLAALALLVCIVCARAFSIPLGDGTLVAFAAVFFMSYRPLRDLGDARAATLRGSLALEALDAIVAIEAACEVGRARRTWPRERLVVDSVGVSRGPEYAPRTSFLAAPGEIVAIVGPTGCGKTTLLRALLGLEPATVGTIRYGSEDLACAGVGPKYRPFAWVPQDAPVISGSLDDNVFLSGHGGKAGDLFASIGAEGLEKTVTGRLGATGRPVSGGERKWIGLARAIASGQPVLLLDEPTSGLDAAAQASVLAALGRLRDTHTVIVVTHQRETLRIADRVVLLGDDGLRSRHAPKTSETAASSQN